MHADLQASQELEDVTLSDDAEFLISSREILCRESVSLPKVCIHTGQTENLQQREATFHSAGMIVAGLFLPVVVLIVLFTGDLIGGSWLGMIVLAICGTALLPVLARLKVPGIVSIKATWHVSDEYLRRCRWQQWCIRGVIVAVMFSVGFAVGYDTTAAAASPIITGLQTGSALGGICGIISLALRMERRIRYSSRRRRGLHKGLFALTGHSRRFTESVERIIHGGF